MIRYFKNIPINNLAYDNFYVIYSLVQKKSYGNSERAGNQNNFEKKISKLLFKIY